MQQEIEQYIAQCHSCQQRKNPKISARVPLGNIVVKRPFDVVSVDFQVPYTTSNDNYKHILVFTDHFTRWCEIIPTKDQLATTVAKIYVQDIFCRYGASRVLLSDRGKNFMSELISEVNKRLGVHHAKTTSYHPQTNGAVESQNKTIANMLSHFTNPDTHKDWPEYVPFCQLAHNSSRTCSINYTPSMLLMGREMKLPYELTKPQPAESSVETDDHESYGSKLHKRMTAVWDKAREVINKGKETQKRYYDRKAAPSTLQVSDIVMYYDKRGYKNKTSKLIKRWSGMYVVKEKTDHTAVIIPFNNPEAAPMRVSLNLLKRYLGPTVRGPSSDISIDLDSPIDLPDSEGDLIDLSDSNDELPSAEESSEDVASSSRGSVKKSREETSKSSDHGATNTNTDVDAHNMTGHMSAAMHSKQNKADSSEQASTDDESESSKSEPNLPPPRTKTAYGLRQRPKRKRDKMFQYSDN